MSKEEEDYTLNREWTRSWIPNSARLAEVTPSRCNQTKKAVNREDALTATGTLHKRGGGNTEGGGGICL